MNVYKITNLINGKIYIGQDTKDRATYFGSGRIIANAIKKYGKYNFKKDILEYCFSNEDLDAAEEYWISYFNSDDRRNHGYNIIRKARGGNIIHLLSEEEYKEYQKKQSISQKIRHSKMSEKQKKEISKKIQKSRNKNDLKLIGRKISHTKQNKSEEEKKLIKEKNSLGTKKIWKQRTEEEKKLIKTKISNSAKGKRRIYLPDGTYRLSR